MNRIKRTLEYSLMLLVLLASILGISIATAVPAAAQDSSDRVVVDQDLTIEQADIVTGNVTVTNGDLTIYGTVDGKVTVVSGNVNIYGKVLGDVAVLTGGGVTVYGGGSVGGNILAPENIDLQDNSFVGGSVTSVGGKVIAEEKAIVKGNKNTVTNPAQAIKDLIQPDQVQQDNFDSAFSSSPLGRITGMFSVGLLSVLILLLSAGLAAAMPGRVRTASATLQAEPAPSIVVGIITAFLIFPAAGLVAFVLTISVVGIILLPVLALALLASFLFGFVVVGHWLGKHLHDTTMQGTGAPMSFQSPTLIVDVLLGVAVLLASTLIPLIFLPAWITVLMFLLVYSVACMGLGAAILSRLGTLSPPKQRHPQRIIYPTPTHNHYGSTLQHNPPPVQMAAAASSATTSEPTNTRPLGPTPTLPRED